jgi:hypothetical protein
LLIAKRRPKAALYAPLGGRRIESAGARSAGAPRLACAFADRSDEESIRPLDAKWSASATWQAMILSTQGCGGPPGAAAEPRTAPKASPAGESGGPGAAERRSSLEVATKLVRLEQRCRGRLGRCGRSPGEASSTVDIVDADRPLPEAPGAANAADAGYDRLRRDTACRPPARRVEHYARLGAMSASLTTKQR